MKATLSRWIDGFANLNILVIGEAMLDRYLVGTTGRLCREGPVPIVALSACHDSPGGAANTAVNTRALGARVTLLSVIGDDPEGQSLRRALDERGVHAEAVFVDPHRRTLAKNRVVAESQLLVRYDHGSTGPVDSATEEALIDRLSERFASCDAVIVSDYGYGILTPRVIAALADLQEQTPRVLVADSKDLAAYRRAGLTAVKPNYEEALTLIGRRGQAASGARADEIVGWGDRILKVTGARLAAVTLDTEGAIEIGRASCRERVCHNV